jgi:dTDP-glucose 4,6-dehydratase
MRVLITGGAGFIGSHLCDALVARGERVFCLDNLSTGSTSNIEHLIPLPNFEFIEADVTSSIDFVGPVHSVIHLASPASPTAYHSHPLETLAAGSKGTENALRLAVEHNARFLLASTSEVYGDPAVHPQPEGYWGHVNPIGPRSVYDEAKRFAEALTVAYRRVFELNTGIVRIFNTYGPRMRATDGRVVSNFIAQALRGEALTIYGDGSQTRSFCYISDLIRGLELMLDATESGPVNLGNPEEMPILELAEIVLNATGSKSDVYHESLPQDEPARRCPSIKRAKEALGWYPRISTREGVRLAVEWFRSVPEEIGIIAENATASV